MNGKDFHMDGGPLIGILFLVAFAVLGFVIIKHFYQSWKQSGDDDDEPENKAKQHAEPKSDDEKKDEGHTQDSHGGHDDHHGPGLWTWIIGGIAATIFFLFFVWLFAGGGFTVLLAWFVGEPHPFQAASTHPTGTVQVQSQGIPPTLCAEEPIDISVDGNGVASARANVNAQCRAFIFPSLRTDAFQIHCTTMAGTEALWDDTKGHDQNPCWNQRQLWFSNDVPMSVHLEFRQN